MRVVPRSFIDVVVSRLIGDVSNSVADVLIEVDFLIRRYASLEFDSDAVGNGIDFVTECLRSLRLLAKRTLPLLLFHACR